MRKLFTLLVLSFVGVVLAGCASTGGGSENVFSGATIYLRHGATDGANESAETVVLDDCATQRNLSELGQEQASELGQFFLSEGVRPSEVLSSPFCRCLDTARIVFGSAVREPELATFHWDAETAKRERMTWFRRELGRDIPAGKTRILVGHSDFIRELGLKAPEEGEGVVFRPDGRGGFDEVGRILQNPVRFVEKQ